MYNNDYDSDDEYHECLRSDPMESPPPSSSSSSQSQSPLQAQEMPIDPGWTEEDSPNRDAQYLFPGERELRQEVFALREAVQRYRERYESLDDDNGEASSMKDFIDDGDDKASNTTSTQTSNYDEKEESVDSANIVTSKRRSVLAARRRKMVETALGQHFLEKRNYPSISSEQIANCARCENLKEGLYSLQGSLMRLLQTTFPDNNEQVITNVKKKKIIITRALSSSPSND
jgi:hypothetical protein